MDNFKETYYRYFDKKSNRFYYHNPIINKRVWILPENIIVKDPKTKEILNNIEKNNNIIEEIFNNKVPPRKNSTLPIQKPSDYMTLPRKLNRGTRKSTLLTSFNSININDNNLSPLTIPIYLPSSIIEDQKPFDTRTFCTTKFNIRTKGSFFNKKEIPPEELLLFDTDTSILPILKSTPTNLTKICINLFNLILDYCKQLPKAQPSELIETLMKEKNLIDEIFIILIKLIHNNPNFDHVKRIWELILSVSTFFPTSIDIQKIIKHNLAVNALGTNQIISTIAKICYIRFFARCDCGEIFPKQKPIWTNLIPTHPYQDFFIFGAPLLELIYAQRRSAPKCTIPLFMHRFCYALFKAGAKENEGTFRLPGNKIQIDLLVEKIHNGQEDYEHTDLRDLASVFKRWLADLPEPIIPMALYNDLVNSLKNKTLMEFIKILPKVNHDTLGYLIGFLQEFVKAESITKMGIIPVSMIFGANVVRIVSNDPKKMKEMTDHGKSFMEFLLINWDVSFIYPLPTEFLPQ